MPKRMPEQQLCTATTVDGKRCTLKRQPYGDGKLCGVHFHRERRKKLAREYER
ncbi:MAG TPA: hypothetical protein VFF06_21560 [Polyangia bacterium]|nr:hypothetical protein [Polyangia bacterium]